MTEQEFNERCRGCLVGGAVGDAMGYPVEFIPSFQAIELKYGPQGIQNYDYEFGYAEGGSPDVAVISDDTQMTLYTADGLLCARYRGLDKLDEVRKAYLDWYAGQKGYDNSAAARDLAKIEALNQQRAPGSTCLASLGALAAGDPVENDSKGCGGIMRIAPVAIEGAATSARLSDTARLAADIALITHKHAQSTYASATAAMLMQMCLRAETGHGVDTFVTLLEIVLGELKQLYPGYPDEMKHFQDLMAKAVRLARESKDADADIIEHGLGGGWVAEETLAIAIFSIIRHFGSFRRAILTAVNHGGDSDSTGAVAGNIAGALYGIYAIPEEWRRNVEFSEMIGTIAERLALK